MPAYKKIYGFYKSHGVELIVHHSDSYAATLVPYMIEMGIDVFQGCVTQNNVPELIKKYGGKISFMGNINNSVVDVPNWTRELVAREVEKACTECGKLYFIPGLVGEAPAASHPSLRSSKRRNSKNERKDVRVIFQISVIAILDEDQNPDTGNIAQATQHCHLPWCAAFYPVSAVYEHRVHKVKNNEEGEICDSVKNLLYVECSHRDHPYSEIGVKAKFSKVQDYICDRNCE